MRGVSLVTTWWRRVRRNADTAWLMLAAALTGVVGLTIADARSKSIVEQLPVAAQMIWYGGLLIGGVLGSLGLLWGGRKGLILERLARWPLAFLCVAFGFAVTATTGAQGVASAAFVGLYGLGCAARAYEIRRELRAPSGEAALHDELAAMRAELAALRADMPGGAR